MKLKARILVGYFPLFAPKSYIMTFSENKCRTDKSVLVHKDLTCYRGGLNINGVMFRFRRDIAEVESH